MFESVPQGPADKIFALVERFKKDERADKMTLLAGVLCDEQGKVPVLSSVKAAERQILENEDSKNYLLIEGNQDYRNNVLNLLTLDASNPNLGVLHTPGGTGALCLAAEFLTRQFSDSTVWLSNPTWPNHPHVFKQAGMKTAEYRYYDKTNKTIVFEQTLEDLKQAKAKDVVLFHACCHNPTGADFSEAQWREVLALVQEKQLLPLFDIAYQGLANSLEEDAVALKLFYEAGVEFLIASSFSKNFSLYNERVGALSVVCDSEENYQHVFSQLKITARGIYSNPPAHGANIVNTILNSADLTQQWHQDLDTMKARVNGMRELLSTKLGEALQKDCGYINHQNGLFSFMDVTPEQAEVLRSEHGVYMLDSGRINVANINPQNVDRFCEAVRSVTL